MSMTPEFCLDYCNRLNTEAQKLDWDVVCGLAAVLEDAWRNKRQVFVAGNGGSGANAVHIANDFLYPISKVKGEGLRVHALTANSGTVTCLGNDEGYDEIFAYQLAVLADAGDVLIVLSGSGNSPNIIKALEESKKLGMKSFGFLGFSGGKALEMVDHAVHAACDDMQICEDLQMIIANCLMQYLYQNQPKAATA